MPQMFGIPSFWGIHAVISCIYLQENSISPLKFNTSEFKVPIISAIIDIVDWRK